MPRAAKRPATDTNVALTPKTARREPMLDGIEGAIKQVQSLSESCREMMLAMAPCAFSTPAAERHQLQAAVVRMVGEVMAEAQGALEHRVESHKASMVDVEQQRAALGSVRKDKEQDLAARAETVDAKTVALADVTQAFITKRAAAEAATAAQRQGELAQADAKAVAEKYEGALSAALLPLIQGTLPPDARAKAYEGLGALLGPLGLDESLVSTLPGSCSKTPEERGTFEKVIMSTLEDSFRKHLADLRAREREAADAVPPLSREAEQAAAIHDRAQEQQLAAAAELCAATAARQTAQAALLEAQGACDRFDDGARDAISTMEDRKAQLEAFVTWNLACFEMLRDKEAPRQPEILPAAAAEQGTWAGGDAAAPEQEAAGEVPEQLPEEAAQDA